MYPDWRCISSSLRSEPFAALFWALGTIRRGSVRFNTERRRVHYLPFTILLYIIYLWVLFYSNPQVVCGRQFFLLFPWELAVTFFSQFFSAIFAASLRLLSTPLKKKTTPLFFAYFNFFSDIKRVQYPVITSKPSLFLAGAGANLFGRLHRRLSAYCPSHYSKILQDWRKKWMILMNF